LPSSVPFFQVNVSAANRRKITKLPPGEAVGAPRDLSFAHAICKGCGERSYCRPLHGERGGPLYCLPCIGKWDAEHMPKRRARRALIRAMSAYTKAGCSLYSTDFNELKLLSDGILDSVDSAKDDFKDLTSELLTAALALTHPDRHPLERKAEAERVTQELSALKPFVFPAPPPPKPEPPPKRRSKESEAFDGIQKLKSYPCDDCREALSCDY
jgi:hypothetical protein